MNQETTPGFVPLITDLLSYCYTRADYTLNAENALSEFSGRRVEDGVILSGSSITYPTLSEDSDIRERFFQWIITYPYVLVFIDSLLPDIDKESGKQKIEHRGFMIEYKNGAITYKRIPREAILDRSIDSNTGQHVRPETNELYF
jgi:hypothetical protein